MTLRETQRQEMYSARQTRTRSRGWERTGSQAKGEMEDQDDSQRPCAEIHVETEKMNLGFCLERSGQTETVALAQ